MIPVGVVIAFFLAIALETTFLLVTDRRAIARERTYWAELRADAEAGYGRVFDWERDA